MSFVRDCPNGIEIYVDGACSNDGTSYAKVGIGVFINDDHPENVSKFIPHRNTIHGAEIEAVLEAVSIVRKHRLYNVIIYTDSEFVITWVNAWIKRCHAHPLYENDFETLATAMHRWQIQVLKVTGHFENYGNQQAVKLAKKALK